MAFVVGSVLLTVFCTSHDGIFACMLEQKKGFRDRIARSRPDLKGKMAMGCAAFSSAKPVYYIGTCSFLYGGSPW